MSSNLQWSFQSPTAAADPGAGNIRFNHATFGSVTAIHISKYDMRGTDQSALIAGWGGIMELAEPGDGGFCSFTLGTVTDNTGWFTIVATPKSGAKPSNATPLNIDAGAAGSGGGASEAYVDAAVATKSTNHGTYTSGLVVNPYDLVSKDGILYESSAATFTTTNWATDQASFNPVAYGQAAVDAAIAAAIPLRYKFTGDGGAATGTIGVNTFPMAVTVTNPGAGVYRFTAASGTPFTVGKTDVSVAVIEATNPLVWRLTQLNSTTVYIEIFDTITGGATDPATGYTITIETEP